MSLTLSHPSTPPAHGDPEAAGGMEEETKKELTVPHAPHPRQVSQQRWV